jgi:hypothetical protein
MHPIFEVVGGQPRGWAITDRTPLQERHIAANSPPGRGDDSGYGDAGIHHPLFHALRLTPYRIQILRAEQLASGDLTPRRWRREE